MNKFLAIICTSLSIISFDRTSAMNSISEFSNIIQDNSIQDNSTRHDLSFNSSLSLTNLLQSNNISSIYDLEQIQKRAELIIKYFDNAVYSILHPYFDNRISNKIDNKYKQYVSLYHLEKILEKFIQINEIEFIVKYNNTRLIIQNLLNNKKIRNKSISRKIIIGSTPSKICSEFVEELEKLNEQKSNLMDQFEDIKYSYDLMSSISEFPNNFSSDLKSFLGCLNDFLDNIKQLYENKSINKVSDTLYYMNLHTDNANMIYRGISRGINKSKNPLVKLAMNLKKYKQFFIDMKNSLFKIFYASNYQPVISETEETLKQFENSIKCSSFAGLTNWINSIQNKKVYDFKIFCNTSSINLLRNLMRNNDIFPPILADLLIFRKKCIKICDGYFQNYVLFIKDIKQRYLQTMQLYENFKIIVKLQNEFNKELNKESVEQFQSKIKTFFEYVESIIENYNNLNVDCFIEKSKRINITATVDDKINAMNNLISQIINLNLINLNSSTQTSSISNLIKQLQLN